MAFNPMQYPAAMALPSYLTDVASWQEHIPFVMALISQMKPAITVELGTFKGDSYMAMCQATAASGHGGKCFAVDTWRGDAHAGEIGDELLTALRGAHDGLYGSFSTLMQMTFDEAVGRFEKGSIDLLHIDGLHTYDAVKHDFETWVDRLSPRGVVMFHDTMVRQADFGVHQFWAEAREKHRGFEFAHGHGLGVLAVGPEAAAAMGGLLEAGETDLDNTRAYFAHMGTFVAHLRVMRLLAAGSTQVRGLVEEWMKQAGVKRNAQTPNWDTQLIVNHPVPFWNQLLAELQGMASYDLQLRQQVGPQAQNKGG